ncbi:Flagellar basal body rod protein [Candidatus Regiella insecticola 5.15]|uniref:Flagellar basal body rod protein n=1 Tax=Candidatus Regiella insecticola 5.15 TaxID=1005043 RepID=G2H0I4_9ENTR|nr:flagellar basal body rod C-terminal domain-containing protein [Candidatus Regiella insecticola]EGY28494.1 Flagellar basal body rod protein [Candidatus Regiella insecticola 5.15]
MAAIYIANESIQHQQEIIKRGLHNLTNGYTFGYLADVEQAISMQIMGAGYPSQFTVALKNSLVDMTPGTLEKTGRDLDIALENNGLIALQGDEGEIYTANGHMERELNGQLTIKGLPVLGEGGAIFLPERYQSLLVASDGTITVMVNRNGVNVPEDIGRIKLVDMPKAQLRTLYKNGNGLLVADSRSVPRSENVRVVQKSLAKSNVDSLKEVTTVTSAKNHSAVMANLMKSTFEMYQMGNQTIKD